MSETLTEAATYIEQGHVRVGPHAVTDPAVRLFFSTSSARWSDSPTVGVSFTLSWHHITSIVSYLARCPRDKQQQ